MGIVSDILGQVDAGIASVARDGFVAMAGSVGNTITIGATVALSLMAANAVLQVRPMGMGALFAYGMKVALIGIFAQSWDNFSVVYDIVTDVPESIGAAILDLTDLQDDAGLYDALDGMLARMTEYGDAVGEHAGWVAGAVMTALFYLIAAIFAAVAAGIIAFAKIMLVIMIVMAPFAITASMFAPTKSLFEAWTRSLTGYAIMPIAAAGAVGIIVAIGDAMAAELDPDSVVTIATILPFLAVLILSIGIMASVPTIAQNLSGAMHLASNAATLQGFARTGMMRAPSETKGAVHTARGHLQSLGERGTAAIEKLQRAGDGPAMTPGRQLDIRNRVLGSGRPVPNAPSKGSVK